MDPADFITPEEDVLLYAWVSTFDSALELERWAYENYMLGNPMIQRRIFELGGGIPSTSTGILQGSDISHRDQGGDSLADILAEAEMLDVSSQVDSFNLNDLFASQDNLQDPQFDLNEFFAEPNLPELWGDWKEQDQRGGGSEPPSKIARFSEVDKPYSVVKKGERVFKNLARDVSYQIKLDEHWEGKKVKDIQQNLHHMFQDVLNQAREGLSDQDKGRVLINHQALDNPVVVPLQHLGDMNANKVLEAIEKVLQSHEELSVDSSLDITVGTIQMPKGGTGKNGLPITNLRGQNSSRYRKRSIVEIRNPNDQMCLARSLVVGHAKESNMPKRQWYNLINKKCREQRNAALELHLKAGVPCDRPSTLEDIPAFQVISANVGNKFIYVGPEVPSKQRIYVYYHKYNDIKHYDCIINICGFFGKSYFCSSCLTPYKQKNKHSCEVYCIVCKNDDCKESDTPMTCHTCHMTCRSEACFHRHRSGTDPEKKTKSECDTYRKCKICFKVINITKRNWEEHVCGEWTCHSCHEMVVGDHHCYLRQRKPEEENTKFIFFDFETYQSFRSDCELGYRPTSTSPCVTCQKLKQPCPSCSKCINCGDSSCGRPRHTPNFVVAHRTCASCIDMPVTPDATCSSCADRCPKCDDKMFGIYLKSPCQDSCARREKIFDGLGAQQQFGEWLFSEQHKGYTAVAHNMKGYDGYFLLDYIINQSMHPHPIIFQGSKIMYMHVPHNLNIRVIDSLNFLPMRLAALPKAFGLTELKKGWFPHYFNTQENQDYIGPYPDPSFYGMDSMSGQDRQSFLDWYSRKGEEIFDFRKEMTEYCRSDVDILRQSCLKFRDQLMHVTGELQTNQEGEFVWVNAIDPLNFTTIASVCMGVYRCKYLDEEWLFQVQHPNGQKEWLPARLEDQTFTLLVNGTWVKKSDLKKLKVLEKQFVSSLIAQVPQQGYNPTDQYSKVSIQWLEWVQHTQTKTGKHIKIQHALNTGEKKVRVEGKSYKLDGYYQEPHTGKQVALEFHGCVFHGCPTCFTTDRQSTKHPKTGQSVDELYALTLRKKAHLEKLGYTYKCIWECEFGKLVDNDPDLRQFLKDLDICDRLNPRDSFFGGRTNAAKLHYKIKGDERIHYVDFTSLYPSVCKYAKYPLKHPTILTKDFGTMDQYFGIAKVKVLPPRGLYHPVLPYRSNGKLKFPLCRTCADMESKTPCQCSDELRAITGTWCTPELDKAIQKGYEIQNVYEVWHWEESTQYDPATRKGGLFVDYINTFLKIKQEASGWPAWCKTEEDKKKYVEDYFEREGIHLDWDFIERNPGLRSLAKLCLNSFWGKFGQRTNMRRSKFIFSSEAELFFQLLTDPSKEVVDFHIISEDVLHVDWQYKDQFIPEDNQTNIFIATFTTCWARLKLYDLLEQLDQRVLYYDTDSVIYVSRPGYYDPPLGDYLGELTDELDGHYIEEFVSGGPKNYAYRLENGQETCKVRGFTLNFTNSQIINFDTVKDLVIHHTENKTVAITNPSKITRDKLKRKLYNRPETKTYGVVYTKRVIQPDLDTLPYGF